MEALLALGSTSQEVDSAFRIQILDEAVYASLYGSVFLRYKSVFYLHPQLGGNSSKHWILYLW